MDGEPSRPRHLLLRHAAQQVHQLSGAPPQSSKAEQNTPLQVAASEGIRAVDTFERGVLALSQTGLRLQLRRGIPMFSHQSANMQEMQCMLRYPQRPTQVTPDPSTLHTARIAAPAGRDPGQDDQFRPGEVQGDAAYRYGRKLRRPQIPRPLRGLRGHQVWWCGVV